MDQVIRSSIENCWVKGVPEGALDFWGSKDHINRRILHFSSNAQYKGDTRNHGFVGSLCLCVLFGALVLGVL